MDNNQYNFKAFSTFLAKLSPIEFATLGSLIGIIITANLNANEQNSIGNFFELVGQVILTAQAQSSYNAPSSISVNEFNNFKNDINQKLNIILKQIKREN